MLNAILFLVLAAAPVAVPVAAAPMTTTLATSPDGTCSGHGDCKWDERCEHRECVPHKPRAGIASDCNPGRKDPPPKGKEGDTREEKPVYNPKV